MNRLELPPPPTSQPYQPFPPAPSTSSGQPPRLRDAGDVGRCSPSRSGSCWSSSPGSGRSAPHIPRRGIRGPLFGGEPAHAFIGRSADGEPYRWDPSSTIHYQVDLGPLDDRVLADVNEAVRRVNRASGLAFEFDGFVHMAVNDLVNSGDFVTTTTAGGSTGHRS